MNFLEIWGKRPTDKRQSTGFLTLICSTRIRIQELFFKIIVTRFALREVRAYRAVLFIISRILQAVTLRHEPVDDCKCSYYSFGLFSKHGSCCALHRVPKKDQQYSEHNFDKSKCIVVIFGKQNHEINAKLPIQQSSALSNKMLVVYLAKWNARYFIPVPQYQYGSSARKHFNMLAHIWLCS